MTLIEVMVALLVTTVALLGALATVGATIRGGIFSRNATEASVLAQSQLETIVSMSAASVTTSSPADNTITTENGLDGNGMTGSGGGYTRETKWTTSADGARRVITVKVGWLDGMNLPHYVYASRQKDPQ
jgi:Tfp pilus assembly protein PilV